MRNENLYFIALIPRRELRERITLIKQDFANRFNSRVALRVYPHITLKAPFKLPPDKHLYLLNWFSDLNIIQKPFSIQLKDFGSFPNSRAPVVYINPVSTEELSLLQVKIMLSFISNISDIVNKADTEFKPHITVAYRDLTPTMFVKAWQEYQHKKFDALFEVDAFYLLQHDAKKWNIIATYCLTQDVVAL
jgi:2'-5' RNA ligase